MLVQWNHVVHNVGNVNSKQEPKTQKCAGMISFFDLVKSLLVDPSQIFPDQNNLKTNIETK